MTNWDVLRNLPTEEIAPYFLKEVAFLVKSSPAWGFGEEVETTIGYRYTSTLFDIEYKYEADAIEAIIAYLNAMREV